MFGALDVILQLTARPVGERLLRAGRKGHRVEPKDVTKVLPLVLSFLHLAVQVRARACGHGSPAACRAAALPAPPGSGTAIALRRPQREAPLPRATAHLGSCPPPA